MPKNKLRNIKLDEGSLVDAGASQGAKVVMYKRAGDEPEPLVAAVMKSYDEPKENFRDALADALQMDARHETMEDVFPLIDALRESTVEAMTNLTGEEQIARVRSNVEGFMQAVGNLAGASGTTSEEDEGGSVMDPTELEQRLDEMEKSLEAVTKERDALTKALTDDGYTVEGETVTKAAEPEYIELDGEKVEKAAIPAPLLKRLESQAADIAKMQQERETEALAKRAESEVPNLAGEPAAKAALLKAVDGIEDEAVRGEVAKTLHAADAATRAMFLEKGQTATGEANDDSPEAKLNKMASESRQDGESFEAAFTRVSQTEEGRALRAASR